MLKLVGILAFLVAVNAGNYGGLGYGGLGYGGRGYGGLGYGGLGYGGLGYGGYSAPAVVVKKVIAPVPAPDPVGPPAPYEMGYDIVDGEGNRNSRKESGDAAGNKAGSYSLNLVDGRSRLVTYKADGAGFRAIVKSNEPGTDASQDPADVDRQGTPAKPAVVVKKVLAYGGLGYGGLGYGGGYGGYGGLGYGGGYGGYGGYGYGGGYGGYGGYGYGGGYGGLGYGHGVKIGTFNSLQGRSESRDRLGGNRQSAYSSRVGHVSAGPLGIRVDGSSTSYNRQRTRPGRYGCAGYGCGGYGHW
ncbi:Uncharacterised protein g1332 [Pycnogonum litorale]